MCQGRNTAAHLKALCAAVIWGRALFHILLNNSHFIIYLLNSNKIISQTGEAHRGECHWLAFLKASLPKAMLKF
ncbi:hypothetical protein M947_08435 [Sulfurimonas hongkongensis]|uniref:Uncharacterized protein n=1 Tax=Sulfurimonas hongkongensis TaxID=1172190 RepID=T0JQS9_9BACT|nr:hypothetical protein M947_08435 [Sulfurimonas hongkongensis]